ncbi:MAG: FAD-dependent oxidoreductase [Anaerolineae bacterium]|nr:FAD-dependent oxidoreductase [Anaerolineae bacterium]
MVVGDLATAVDLVVLGGGPGGYVSAIRAAQLGKQVALIDPGPPGGSCLHFHCIPSKALLTATEYAWRTPGLSEMGIGVGPVQVDYAQMQAWKNSVVQRLVKGVQQLLDGHRVQVVHGRGWFLAENEVRVEGEHGASRYSFDHCVIAVGAEARPLPDLPFDHERVLTPGEALRRTTLPRDLALIGSDYVVAEIATIFARLGVPTRILLPPGERLLHAFDPLAGRLVQASLRKLGVKIEANVAGPAQVVADAACVVVSRGVAPRSGDLHLDLVHVDTDSEGFVRVDDQLRTTNPRIYAVGDVTGGPRFATTAIKQAKVAAESLAGRRVQYAPQAIPHVAWTDPPVAAVGLTQAEAEAQGYPVVAGRFPLAANGRALSLDQTEGSVLTVADRDSGVLLGATIIGARAGDLVGELALALEMGATLTDLAETLHPHPGLPELLQESAETALGAAVHVLKL